MQERVIGYILLVLGIIIMAFSVYSDEEISHHHPKVVYVDEQNRIIPKM